MRDIAIHVLWPLENIEQMELCIKRRAVERYWTAVVIVRSQSFPLQAPLRCLELKSRPAAFQTAKRPILPVTRCQKRHSSRMGNAVCLFSSPIWSSKCWVCCSSRASISSMR